MDEGRKRGVPGTATAPMSRARQKRRFGCIDVLDAFALVAPVLVALCAIKAYKTTFALWPVTRTFDWTPPGRLQAVGWVVTSPLFALAAIAFGLAYAGLGIKQRRLSVLPAICALVLPTLVLVNSLRVQSGRDSSFSLHFLNHFMRSAIQALEYWIVMLRADFLVVTGYFLLILLARAYWRGRRSTILFCALNAFFLLVAGLELANYLRTGVTNAGPLLVYLLDNASDLAPLIRSETDAVAVAALVLPLASLLLTPGIRRLGVGMLANGIRRCRPSAAAAASVLGMLLVVSMFAVPNRADQQYHRFEGNVFANLTGAMWRAAVGTPGVRAGFKRHVPDRRHIRFEATPARKRMNVVVVMLESVRAQSTGLHNRRLHNTPFLDSLARKSLVAEDMHAVVPRTSAAWVGVLQGIFPTTNTVMMRWAQDSRAIDSPSLPRLLRPHGYRSAFFAPTHLHYENEGQLITNMGFDRVFVDQNYDTRGFDRTTYFGYEDRIMLRPIMSWVDAQHRDGAPFFLTVMTNVGHHDYKVPSRWPIRKFAAAEDENSYLNCIAYIDDFLSRLIQEFDQRGLAESTVFVILGDHGDSFGEHGVRERAMTLYQEVLHIPALIYAPSLFPDGGRITGLRQQIDVLPTIAQLLDMQIVGGNMPGTSLLEPVPKDRRIFFSTIFDDLSLAMRKGSRKYIYNFDRSPMLAYDLSAQGGEFRDVAAQLTGVEIAQVERDMLDWSDRAKLEMLSTPGG